MQSWAEKLEKQKRQSVAFVAEKLNVERVENPR